jgi:hypothetical protein
LNEQTEADVWLVRVSAIRIGDSAPAPQFTVVAGPEISKEIRRARQAGTKSKSRAEAAAFWNAWLPLARERIDAGQVQVHTTGQSQVFYPTEWSTSPLEQ